MRFDSDFILQSLKYIYMANRPKKQMKSANLKKGLGGQTHVGQKGEAPKEPNYKGKQYVRYRRDRGTQSKQTHNGANRVTRTSSVQGRMSDGTMNKKTGNFLASGTASSFSSGTGMGDEARGVLSRVDRYREVRRGLGLAAG